MTRPIVAAVVVAAGGFCGPSAIAFGGVGHMAVGSVADAMLAGTRAAKQARAILGTNLRTASVWADCAKGVNPASFRYEGAGQFPECAVYENPASIAQMQAYVRRNVGTCSAPSPSEVCHKRYHYTDVAIQRTAYAKGLVGTTDHDIVAAISACIAVLRGLPPPPPFAIAGRKEALRLLSHLVGDIHQPLHVAAVYLDPLGNVVDPDHGAFDPRTETRGGNDLFVGAKKLHGLWDAVTGAVNADTPTPVLMAKARAVPTTPGDPSTWSTAWATETLNSGRAAFDGLRFSREDPQHHHSVTLTDGYLKDKAKRQVDQVARAGARLAQVLKAVWPD